MRKLQTILFIILYIFVLVSCSTENEGSNDSDSTDDVVFEATIRLSIIDIDKWKYKVVAVADIIKNNEGFDVYILGTVGSLGRENYKVITTGTWRNEVLYEINENVVISFREIIDLGLYRRINDSDELKKICCIETIVSSDETENVLYAQDSVKY